MAFDIHQLDNLDYDDAEPILDDYQDAVIDLFAKSPSGQEYLKTHSGIGFWIAQLIFYGYCYEGFTLPKMTKNDVQTVVEQLFPRKISLASSEEADDAIPELIAFWEFLKREFNFRAADSILKYLRLLEPKFRNIMNDPSKFGMAKSFFQMGQAAGFDMTSQSGLNTFVLHYNTNIAPNLADLSPVLPQAEPINDDSAPSSLSRDKISKSKQQKGRDIAKASRKQNRKRRK